MIFLICSYVCLHSVPMSRSLMNDFLHSHNTNSTVHNLSVAPIAMNSNMLLTPNDLFDLTPFGINKVLFNKELPVVLQVIDLIDKSPPAREKITFMEPDGSTTYFLLITKALFYHLPPEVKLFFLMEKYSWKRKSL